MEDTQNVTKNESIRPSSVLLSRHPHCVLPEHFFDMMLEKTLNAGRAQDDETETSIIELEDSLGQNVDGRKILPNC